jgi:DNA-binding Lrp family transcriptional regulator
MSINPETEKKLIKIIQDGFNIVKRPYKAIGEKIGCSENQVIEYINLLLEQGKIKRLGLVPHHYNLGIRANGMSCWNIEDNVASDIGKKIAVYPEITHCYQRPRIDGIWPYNIFGMIHGYTRDQVLSTVDKIASEL